MKKLWLVLIASIGMILPNQAFAASSNHFSNSFYSGNEFYVLTVDVDQQGNAKIAYSYSNDRYSLYDNASQTISFNQNGVGSFQVDQVTATINLHQGTLVFNKTSELTK